MTRRELLALGATGAVAAQQPQQDATFTAGVKVVNIFATVRDARSGALVKELARDDFSLDDERVPQTIRYFASESDLPLTIGLIADTSGSQEKLLPEQREAAAVFTERVIREEHDHVFVLKFDRYVSLVQDLTQSKQRVRKSLAALRPSPKPERRALTLESIHTSRLFDSIQTACERYLNGAAGRRALVVISDGMDTGGSGGIVRAVEAAIRAEAVIFAIRYQDPLVTNPALLPPDPVRPKGGVRNLGSGQAASGRDNLLRLADETGGSFFDADEETPIGQVFALIEQELRSQYNIGFTPAQPGRPDRFRRVRLRLAKPGLEVRHRAGYYPDPL